MTKQDEYVLNIVSKYKRTSISPTVISFLENTLKPDIRMWAGDFLLDDIVYSGSTAKGTAVTFCSDVDIFIPLKNKGDLSLEDIYDSLFQRLSLYSPKKQNVSIGITYSGFKIDIVPGRVQTGYVNFFSLFKSKTKSWTQTNLKKNIDLIKTSGRIHEIIALKIWRFRHNIDISSTLLELLVLEALKNQSTNETAENVLRVLRYLSSNLLEVRIIDPTNLNNVLSDDLSKAEKTAIANKARISAASDYWEEIIW